MDRPPFMEMEPMEWVARHPFLTVLVTDQLPEDEMGGWSPEDDVTVLADDLTEPELRSTLAHELVHRMFGDHPQAPDYGQQELRCRETTARLLLPIDDVRGVLADLLQQAAARLGVDPTTVLDRLRGLTAGELAEVGCA